MRLSETCQQLVRDEMARRTPVWGSRKRLAHELGTVVSGVSDILAGRRPVPERIAWRILAMVRQEELELADRIEAELVQPPLYKEGER